MDAEEREESWRRLVMAVIALRAGRVQDVQSYLRAIEAKKGRAVAELARDQVRGCAKAQSWRGVEQWPAWGYRSKPPEEPHVPPRRRR